MARKRKPNLNKVRLRCRDCKAYRFVYLGEMYRAARPRCLECGGPVEESASGHDKALAAREAAREQGESMRRRAGWG